MCLVSLSHSVIWTHKLSYLSCFSLVHRHGYRSFTFNETLPSFLWPLFWWKSSYPAISNSASNTTTLKVLPTPAPLPPLPLHSFHPCPTMATLFSWLGMTLFLLQLLLSLFPPFPFSASPFALFSSRSPSLSLQLCTRKTSQKLNEIAWR